MADQKALAEVKEYLEAQALVHRTAGRIGEAELCERLAASVGKAMEKQ